MPRKHKAGRPADSPRSARNAGRDTEVRIIGGTFRGRRLRYHGDPVVRPMKHRTREAIFNLVTTESAGRHAIDLFAGTGALGLEALSRGAVRATMIEQHVPTARVVEENIHILGVEDRADLLVTSAFLWAKRDLPRVRSTVAADHGGGRTTAATAQRRDDIPWLVFCSPPYAFYVERQAEMVELIREIQNEAPGGSTLVVEADERFDFSLLRRHDEQDDSQAWDVRRYSPAVVGIWRTR